MSKHTQGPWEVDGEGIVMKQACETELRTRIAVVNGDTEQAKADARLIAAAPELKASAEIALDLMESVQWNDEDIQPEWNAALKMLRDAIAKAGGDS